MLIEPWNRERKQVLEMLVVFFVILMIGAYLKGCSLPSWLGGQTKADVVAINTILSSQNEELKQTNASNEEQHQLVEEAKEASEEVYVESKAVVKEVKKITAAKKTQYKKAVIAIEVDQTLSEDEKTQKVIEVSADSIWDMYCGVKHSTCDKQ